MTKVSNDKLCFYDGFKFRCYLSEYIDFIKTNKEKFNLNFTYLHDKMIKYPIVGKYRELDISIEYTNRGFCVQIAGSFHKYFNNNEHNYDDFYWNNFIKTLTEIIGLFSLPIEHTLACNLEIGVNIVLPESFKVSAKEFSQSILFTHPTKNNNNETFKNRARKGHSYFYENDNRKTKLYDKSSQYQKFDKQRVRAETKLIRSRVINKIGVISVIDLFNYDHHLIAARKLYKAFNSAIFLHRELENMPCLTNEEKISLLQFHNPSMWQRIHRDRNLFRRTKNKYNRLIKKYCSIHLTEFILSEIDNKINWDCREC